jgi:transcriptional regulator with XRE-family HTH domain
MPKLNINNKEEFKTTSSDGETIGKRIARFRKKKGLTQKELAEKIGIDRTLITNYELGRARVYDEMLTRIALTLNVSADLLLGIKDNIDKKESHSLKIMKRVYRIEKLPLAQQKIILRGLDLNLTGIEKELSEQ